MAIIRINQSEDAVVLGRLSAQRVKEYNEEGNFSISISGILETRDYYEDIETIETERLILKGVDVIVEEYGTNEYNIRYSFTADELEVLDDPVPDDIKWYIEETQEYADEKEEYYHTFNWENGYKKADELAEKLSQYLKEESDDDGQQE